MTTWHKLKGGVFVCEFGGVLDVVRVGYAGSVQLIAHQFLYDFSGVVSAGNVPPHQTASIADDTAFILHVFCATSEIALKKMNRTPIGVLVQKFGRYSGLRGMIKIPNGVLDFSVSPEMYFGTIDAIRAKSVLLNCDRSARLKNYYN